MYRQIAGVAIALVSGLTACRSCPCPCPCPCPPVAGEPPARMAAAEPPRVFVEMTYVRIPEAEVAALPAGAASSSTVLLDAGRKDALLAGLVKDKTVELVNAPAIVAVADQRASVFVGEQFAASTGASRVAPLRFVAPEDDPSRAWIGTSILVTPTVGSGGVDLDIDATWSEAQHPDAKDVAGLVLRRARVTRRLRVTPDQTALVVADGAFEREGKSYRMVLLVGARALAPKAAN